jgi:uncharacterized cupin superfamily protein
MKTISALREPLKQTALVDWGSPPTMIEGHSTTRGALLHKGPDGQSECGFWECTPGTWACEVTRDEFCHFLEGEAVYTSDSGETTEITPDTVAFFPAGWSGQCRVLKTVRKVYMIR